MPLKDPNQHNRAMGLMTRRSMRETTQTAESAFPLSVCEWPLLTI